MSLPSADVGRLRRRGFQLEYVTMAWMVAEAAVAIITGCSPRRSPKSASA